MKAPEVSVVIPAFNEEQRLPTTLAKIRGHLDGRGRPYEIVVVDDGSSDQTVGRAREVPGVVVLQNETNRGKGYSVRRGMLEARGTRRLMTDADLSTPIEDLARLEAKMDEGFDIVIGSRAISGARIEIRQSRYRENVGRLFNVLVRLLAVPGLQDTQCGFKLFSAAAAENVFSATVLDGFSFDVEALFIGRRRGYRIAELPVTWRNDAATRVTTLRGFLAFLDIARIRTNEWTGRYAPRAASRRSESGQSL